MATRRAQIELPRVVDLEDLHAALRAQGFDAEPVDGDGRCTLKVRATEAELM
jgi:hypothetical protein